MRQSTLNPHSALMAFDKLVDNRQPEPGSTGLPVPLAIEASETLKDLHADISRNARAIVAYRQEHTAIGLCDGETYSADGMSAGV